MDNIAHRLATGKRGMHQEHYATIQCRITDDIERLTKELEYNRKHYCSCKKCNMIFWKDLLIDGVCRGCTYPEKNETEKDMIHIKVFGNQEGDCPKCKGGNAMLQHTNPSSYKRVYKCRDCGFEVEWDKCIMDKYKLKLIEGLSHKWEKVCEVGPTPVK